MNNKLMRLAGFEEEVNQVELGNCPFCKRAIIQGSFRDSLSQREFKISGLCQACQDDYLGNG